MNASEDALREIALRLTDRALADRLRKIAGKASTFSVAERRVLLNEAASRLERKR